jgi:AcrR family transcriptional regulator
MNERFHALPDEKQLKIINAGLEVFSRTEYKRASTDEIAAKADISKGLLFYYFHNKKELYFYLFDFSKNFLRSQVVDESFEKITDFFELLLYSSEKKAGLLARTPYITDFLMRAFYSKNEVISEDMQKKVLDIKATLYEEFFKNIDFAKFKPEINPFQIYQMLIWMSNGYLHEKLISGQPLELLRINADYRAWLDLFRLISYKEEYRNARHRD